MPAWPFEPPRAPVEARVRARLPEPSGRACEPKRDGFRALARSRGADGEPRLDSRNRRPLLRYAIPAPQAGGRYGSAARRREGWTRGGSPGCFG